MRECKICAVEDCEKAKHIENHRIQGCDEFKPKEQLEVEDEQKEA